MSILKSVAARAKERTSKPVEMNHPTEPEIKLIFRPPTNRAEIEKLRKRSESQKEGGDFDAALLALCHMETRQYGQIDVDDDGKPLTFRDKAVQEALGVLSAKEAVRAVYGSDGYVSQACKELIAHGGWGGDDILAEEDPT